jgi:hypothetical protein
MLRMIDWQGFDAYQIRGKNEKGGWHHSMMHKRCIKEKGSQLNFCNPLILLVGTRGFEPPAP